MIPHPAITATDTTRADIDALVRAHTATLDWAESATNFPVTLARIASLRTKIRRLASFPASALGMLGHNGIGPEVEDVAKSASFHGFSWRSVA